MGSLSDIVVYDSVMKSNIPNGEKSLIGKWFEKMTSIVPNSDDSDRRGGGLSKEHVITAVQALRSSVEGNAVSFGLGVLDAKVGLDVGKIPLDAAGGVGLTALSIMFAKHEISRDLLNMGNAAGNCFSFRKGHAWAAASQIRQGVEPASKMGQVNIAGEENDDPIVQVAKTIKQ